MFSTTRSLASNAWYGDMQEDGSDREVTSVRISVNCNCVDSQLANSERSLIIR